MNKINDFISTRNKWRTLSETLRLVVWIWTSEVCDRVKIIIIKSSQRGHLLIRWLPLIQQHLNLCLQEGILVKLAHPASCLSVLIAVEATAVSADRRNVESSQWLKLENVSERLHNMCVTTEAIWANTGIKTRLEGIFAPLEAEEKHFDRASFNEGISRWVCDSLALKVTALGNTFPASCG